jgi:hypothetical protein
VMASHGLTSCMTLKLRLRRYITFIYEIMWIKPARLIRLRICSYFPKPAGYTVAFGGFSKATRGTSNRFSEAA